MSVNPNLATLMGLIDELQDKMPEGKYLEAMNALADLHAGRVRPPPPQPPQPFVLPDEMVELTEEEVLRRGRLIEQRQPHRLPDALRELAHTDLWRIVCREWNSEQNPPLEDRQLLSMWQRDARHIRHNHNTERWWASRTVEEKTALVHRALLAIYLRLTGESEKHANPPLEVCPFISRHAVGKWEDPAKNPRAKWNCVCGSVNILAKNWRQHEVSDKHTKWDAEGRNITPCIKKKMLDDACHVRLHGEYYRTFKPSEVWAKQKKDKNWNPALKVCQGVIVDTVCDHICGITVNWKQPHKLWHPQSLNEWICHELKGKPWDYKPTDSRWVTKVSDPVIKATGRTINLEPFEVPRPRPEVPYMRLGRCRVTGRDVPYMHQDDYARFISMEE